MAKSQNKQTAARRDPSWFVNRELSWLQFNRRVLEEAGDPTNPPLERVKFLAITSTNLDEFFEVRIAGTMELVDAGLGNDNPDGMNPRDELDAMRTSARAINEDMHRCWRNELIPALAEHDIRFPELNQLSADQQEWLASYYQREVYPVLTPLAVDPSHPFPTLLNKSLNIAALLLDPRKGPKVRRIAVVQVPRVLSRLVQVPSKDGYTFVFMADVVARYLDSLFPGLQVLHSCSFRVTRDGNIDLDEDDATDLLTSIEQELLKRRRGEPVRLEIDRDAHPEIIERFLEAFGLEPEDMYFCDGPVNLGRVMELYGTVEVSALKDPPYKPHRVTHWQSAEECFGALRDGDILLHHPYQSFSTTEDLVRYAAHDPRVLAIKLIIYRAGEQSPLVEELIAAAQNRKMVTVVVELKARFDEESNIRWARRLEKAGVHVVYGIVGLKTHAKAMMIVRKEDDGIRRYCHLGTGNYNPSTARIYTDLAILTAREDMGLEVADMFNMITGYAKVPPMKHLVVAPFELRNKMTQWIRTEAANAEAGRPARIRGKMNSLADPEIIEELYKASQAGVQIELCVRGICCLRPGVEGLSENIRVISIVDQFLEHPRIYVFENNGDPLVYLASADWMVRNLTRRVESAFPVLDPELRQRVIDEILESSLRDNVKARLVQPDGSFVRVQPQPGEAPLRSQEYLKQIENERRAADGPGGKLRPSPRPDLRVDPEAVGGGS